MLLGRATAFGPGAETNRTGCLAVTVFCAGIDEEYADTNTYTYRFTVHRRLFFHTEKLAMLVM
jgi:hypothetical protein